MTPLVIVMPASRACAKTAGRQQRRRMSEPQYPEPAGYINDGGISR
ncbi:MULTISPECIES: hypothetical protein [unclassified Brenneria]|nr:MULTISPECIES: hypothetical protein [unclassified Brenneria]MDX5628013.1 hypothetical protein [Brenneria sp. L3-3Z]MDX5694967.1 hypothetical protein [Brenneria sp. L4-2C]MEE3660755.1 hypothetical protein [Brenneria sp. g21c3]